MRSPRVGERRWHPGVALALLIVLVVIEVRFYPEIATWLYIALSGKEGWDGSALPAVQIYLVFPAGVIFGALAVGSYVFAWRRAGGMQSRVVGLAWLANVAVMLLSVLWYGSGSRV